MPALNLNTANEHLRRKIRFGFAAFVAILLIFFSSFLYLERVSVEKEAALIVANTAHTLQVSLQDRINLVDQMLSAVKFSYEKGSTTATKKNQLIDSVNLAFKTTPFLSRLHVINAAGEVISSTAKESQNHINYSDRDYFKVHVSPESQDLFISKPIVSRLTQQHIVVFSKRFNKPDGSFGGIVVASVEVETFRVLLASVDYGRHGFSAIRYDDDRSLLIRNVTDPKNPMAVTGNTMNSAKLREIHASKANTAQFHVRRAPDGHERMNAFQRVPGRPFFVVVSFSAMDYLIRWNQHLVAAVTMFSLLVAIGGLAMRWLQSNLLVISGQQKRMQALFDMSAAGIVRSNMAGNFVEFNRAFAAMTGYSASELKAMDYWQLTPKRYMEAEAVQIESMEKTQRYGPYRKQYLRKDGTLVDIELVGVVITGDGEAPYVWSIVTDISQLLRNQQDVERALKAAEAANIAKSQFLATMSHELRTPLNGIQGMAQLLKRPHVADADRIDAAETILQSGSFLTTLLGDLLDASQMDANKLMLRAESCDVSALVQELGALFKSAAAQKNVVLTAVWQGPTAQLYRVDAVRLRQMLTNLISNAFKFTSAGSIEIQASEIERTGREAILQFAVKDSGVGIPLDKQDQLFQRFSQIENEAVHYSAGSGLGLSIVKGLAKRMGGRVGVESQEGVGSRFWFQIQVVVDTPHALSNADATPISSVHVPLALRTPSAGVDALPKAQLSTEFALVVDDNPINQKVMSQFLKEIDISAVCVGNGQEAVDVVQQGKLPKFIVMDVQMPVMDGLEATRRIRALEASQNWMRTPIIGLTAGAPTSNKDKCLESGMDEVLFKPVDLDELEAMIERLCS